VRRTRNRKRRSDGNTQLPNRFSGAKALDVPRMVREPTAMSIRPASTGSSRAVADSAG
jgi:hypothetical protein